MSISGLKNNGFNYLNNGNSGSSSSSGSIISNLIPGAIGRNGFNNNNNNNNNNNHHHHNNNADLKDYQTSEINGAIEKLNLDSSSSSSPKMSIAYINEIVELYAQRFFKDFEKDLYKKIGKDCGWKDLIKNINYKKLRIRHEKPVYKDQVVPGLNRKPYSLFRSTYVNDTDNDQEYQLRTERRTTAVCEIEITKGFVNEASAECAIEIPIPCCVAEVGAGFKREYSLENKTSKNIEEEIVWSVESVIKVPKMHKTIAELVIQEDKYQGEFEMKTYFSGSISVKLFKDGAEVLSFDLNELDDLFTKDRGFLRDQQGIFFVTRGVCKASFGVEQKIVLRQQPLNEKNKY